MRNWKETEPTKSQELWPNCCFILTFTSQPGGKDPNNSFRGIFSLHLLKSSESGCVRFGNLQFGNVQSGSLEFESLQSGSIVSCKPTVCYSTVWGPTVSAPPRRNLGDCTPGWGFKVWGTTGWGPTVWGPTISAPPTSDLGDCTPGWEPTGWEHTVSPPPTRILEDCTPGCWPTVCWPTGGGLESPPQQRGI